MLRRKLTVNDQPMGKGKGNNYVPDKVTDGLDNLGNALEDGKDTIKDEVG